jgi:hypothetical protein
VALSVVPENADRLHRLREIDELLDRLEREEERLVVELGADH